MVYLTMKYMLLQIRNSLRFSILSCVMLIFTFLFLDLSLYQYEDSRYQIMNVENFIQNTNEMIHVDVPASIIESIDTKLVDKIIKEMSRYKSVVSYGHFQYFTMIIDNEKESLQSLYVNKELLSINGSINAKIKNLPESNEHSYIPVLLGNDFSKKYQMNQIITSPYTNQVFKVVGFLDKDSSWLSDSLFYTGNTMISLNNKMIAVTDKSGDESAESECQYINNIYFQVNGKPELFKNEFMKCANKYGLDVKLQTVTSMISDYEKEQEDIIVRLRIIALIVLIVSTMSMLMTNIVLFYKRRYEYSILIASGFSFANILSMIIIENLIKLSLAIAVAWASMESYWRTVYALDYVRVCLVHKKVLMLILVIGGFIFTVSILGSYIEMKRTSVHRMMGGNYHD